MTARLSDELIGTLRTCYDRGESRKETSRITGVNYITVIKYFCSWKRDFDNPAEYLDHLAREKDFPNHNSYKRVREMSKYEEERHHEINLEDLARCLKVCEMPEVEEIIQREEIARVLCLLESENRLEYDILVKTFYERKPSEQIGKEMLCSGQHIRLHKKLGLQRIRKLYLKRVLDGCKS